MVVIVVVVVLFVAGVVVKTKGKIQSDFGLMYRVMWSNICWHRFKSPRHNNFPFNSFLCLSVKSCDSFSFKITR